MPNVNNWADKLKIFMSLNSIVNFKSPPLHTVLDNTKCTNEVFMEILLKVNRLLVPKTSYQIISSEVVE